MRLLVVDDDVEVRDLLARALERDGHVVSAVATIDQAQAVLKSSGVDLIVLDLALPDGDGLSLCRQLRAAQNDVSVLMLTAHSDVTVRVGSLDAGADDFLGKPFAVAELRARVRALGRRRSGPLAKSVIQRASVLLDFSARRASKQGRSIDLTAREWIVLEALAARQGRVVARRELLMESWGEATEATSASLEVLIGRIRRKLGNDPIRTVRGEGYALETS
jgi:two-component system, OmpR family, response regulator